MSTLSTPPTPAPGESVRQASGYTFFIGDQDGNLVLGMTTFAPGEGLKLAARVTQVCNRLLRSDAARTGGTQAADTTFVSHSHEESLREALGYARGTWDASGIPPAGGDRWVNPALAFARAWADSWESGDYAQALREAYATWQDSGGHTVARS
jgi:hypothetical protein